MRHILKQLASFSLAAAFAASCWGQTFSSGSTGSDGAYNPTQSGLFDPVALGLNPAGDNVFNFTTINIPSGVTITLRADKLRNAAVVWLATGNVTIAGHLVLDGQAGNTLNASDFISLVQNRVYPIPGPGGYAGGLGARNGTAPESGAGPGGGGAEVSYYGGPGNYWTQGYNCGHPMSPTYGSPYLVPLLGGSGGGGGGSSTGTGVGGIGGAGGGAIRIVSTTQISIAGMISAQGGPGGTVNGTNSGYSGGGGSGGAVHLISPTITGTGPIYVYGGSGGCSGVAGAGIVRFNVTNSSYTGTIGGPFLYGPVYNVPANSTQSLPSLSITQINGINVPANPTGSYLAPDIQVNTSNAVNVNIAAQNIPVGTVVGLRVTSETGSDTLISCSPLSGATAASTTASCSATYPFSISISSLRATW